MDLIYESHLQSEQILVERRGARYSDPITNATQTFIPLKLEPLILSITSDLAPTLVD